MVHRHFNTQLNVGYTEGRVEQARGREEEGAGQHRAGVVLGAKQDFARAEPGALEKWATGSRTPGGDGSPRVGVALHHFLPWPVVWAPSREPPHTEHADSGYQIDANHLTRLGGQGIAMMENRSRYL